MKRWCDRDHGTLLFNSKLDTLDLPADLEIISAGDQRVTIVVPDAGTGSDNGSRKTPGEIVLVYKIRIVWAFDGHLLVWKYFQR